MKTRVTTESARRVSDCVTGLLRSQPYFGSLALRLPLSPDSTRKTLACDGRNIRFSPEWVADTHAHLIETSIARVVLACSLKHHTRRDDRDPERWQQASQLVTHSMLRDAGFIPSFQKLNGAGSKMQSSSIAILPWCIETLEYRSRDGRKEPEDSGFDDGDIPF